MQRSDDGTDELLAHTERLLEELESVDAEEPQANDGARVGQRPHGTDCDEEDRPGEVRLSVADDAMRVAATFTPPAAHGEPITAHAVVEALAAHEIVHGLDHEAITSSVWRCNTERAVVPDVVVARGTRPVDARTEHTALRQKLLYRRHRSADDDAPVDHRRVSRFVLVEKGDVLAKVVAERPGRPGSNVFGEPLPFRTRRIASPRAGANVTRDGAYFRAAIHGRLLWDGRSFAVNPVLELREDVDYHTGNIDFPGDVILHRGVKDGFQVHAEGSVVCMQTLDASDVVCGGDLTAHGGIIGRGRASIVVSGRVVARYVENCELEARGDVIAELGIVNSLVRSLGTVRTGSRGVIVGGSVHALNGVQAAQIGTRAGPDTSLHCGTDFEAARKLAWVQDRNREIAIRLERVRARRTDGAHHEGSVTRMEERLKSAQAKLQEATVELMERLDPNDTAAVTVAGTVYAGTYLEVCHVACRVERDERSIVYSLNKRRGIVESNPR